MNTTTRPLLFSYFVLPQETTLDVQMQGTMDYHFSMYYYRFHGQHNARFCLFWNAMNDVFEFNIRGLAQLSPCRPQNQLNRIQLIGFASGLQDPWDLSPVIIMSKIFRNCTNPSLNGMMLNTFRSIRYTSFKEPVSVYICDHLSKILTCSHTN